MSDQDRHRASLLLLLLVLLLGYLAVRSHQGELAAAERLLRLGESPLLAAHATASGVGEAVGEVFRREHLHGRLRDLESRLAQAEAERASLAEAGRENARLRGLLDLQAVAPAAGRASRVIAADPTAPSRSVVIDLGARDGVATDAAVLSDEGLVGRVVRVGERTAVVQLVDDSLSAVAVLNERSRVQGLLAGAGPGECRLRYVPNLEDVRPDDRLLASGLDGIYPKGVVAGVVTEVRAGADAFQEIHVRAAASLNRLEVVLVLTARAPSGAAAGVEEVARLGGQGGRP